MFARVVAGTVAVVLSMLMPATIAEEPEGNVRITIEIGTLQGGRKASVSIYQAMYLEVRADLPK
jgi:hypothetical protein